MFSLLTGGWPVRAVPRRAAWLAAAGVILVLAVALFLPPRQALGLGLGVAAAGLILRRPVWGVYALVLSVPVQREVALVSGHGTATQAVMAFLLLAWWAWMAVRRARIFVPPFALALAVYLVVMLASLIVATSLSAGLAEIARWSVVLLSYLIIIHTVRTRAEVVGLIVCFFLGASAEGLLGLWQVATRQVPPSFFVGQGGDPESLAPRAFGTIGAPNSYAGYLNLTLALALALALYLLVRAVQWSVVSGQWSVVSRQSAARSIALALGVTALAALMGAGLVLSFSRGGLIGLGFGVLGMTVALGRRALPALLGLAVGGVLFVGLALAGALPASLADRLSSITSQLQIYDVRGVETTPDTFNQIERLVHWQVAGNMFLASPWIGVGVGNYNLLFPRYTIEGWPISRGQAHNYYLQALAETGVIGLAAYLVLLGTAIAAGVRALRRVGATADPFPRVLLIGALGVVMTVAGHSVFEDLHVLNLGIHWAAVIALFYLVPRLWGAAPAQPAALR